MKPVKDEIFGTRPSRLEPILRESKILHVKNLFCVTCLYRYNKNKHTRYAILYDCNTPAELGHSTLAQVLHAFTVPCFDIHISKNNNPSIYDYSHGSLYSFQTRDDLAKYLLNRLSCASGILNPSTAKILETTDVSELSRFLRKDVYGRLATTDIDFLVFGSDNLPKSIVEEKVFLHEQGFSIGNGAYISMREILLDMIQPYLGFYLVAPTSEDVDEWWVYDFTLERNKNRTPSVHDHNRREQRVIISFSEMTKVSTKQLIAKITGE